MKIVGLVLLGIIIVVLLGGLCFGLEWLGIEWEGFFAAKREGVRREVYEETKSYNEGKAQQLSKLHLEYVREKDEDAKKAIAASVRQSFADYDPDDIKNTELRSWLKAVQAGRK